MSTYTAPDTELRYRRKGWVVRIRNHPAGPVSIVFLALLVGAVIAGLMFPTSFFFLSVGNMNLLLLALPSLGIVALGVGLLMIAGEFDLSVGSVYVAAPFAMAFAFTEGAPVALAILFAFAIAIGIGLSNAFITLRFGIPSFITTLGMMFIVRTAAPFLVGYKRSIPVRFPEEVKFLLAGKIGIFPMAFLWFIVLAILAHVLLFRHRIGNHFFAVGGDPRAARFAGINVWRTKTIAFVLSSMFATAAGILQVVRLNNAQTSPQLFIELFAVAVCVIGGLSLFGGRGTVIGIVLGVAVLELVRDVIILARLPGFYLDMFVGMMIVLGVVLNQAVKKRY